MDSVASAAASMIRTVALACACLLSVEAAAGSPRSDVLSPGTVDVRCWADQLRQSFTLSLRKSDFVELRLDSPDLSDAALFGPDNSVITRVGHHVSSTLRLSAIASVDGEYTLQLSRRERSAPASNLRVTVEEWRPGRSGDRGRVDALTLVSAAEQLRANWNRRSLWRAVALYRRAARSLPVSASALRAHVHRALGDTYETMGMSRPALSAFIRAERLYARTDLTTDRCHALAAISRLQLVTDTQLEARQTALGAVRLAEATKSASCAAAALVSLADVESFVGESQPALEHYTTALKEALAAGDAALQGSALLGQGYAYSDLSNVPSASESYARALALWKELGNRRQEGATFNALGHLHAKVGQRQRALEELGRAETLLAAVGDQFGLAVSHDGAGFVYLEVGEYDLALARYQRKLAAFRAANHRAGQAGAIVQIGHCYYGMGRYVTALRYLRWAVSELSHMRDARVEAYAQGLLGLAYQATAAHDPAARAFKRELDLSVQNGDVREQSYALNRLALLRHRQGRSGEAMDLLAQARHLSSSAADPAGEALSLFSQATVQRDRGELATALDLVNESLAIAELLRKEVGSPDLRASYFASVRDRHEFLISLLVQLDAARPGGAFASQAFEASERAHARSLLEAIQQARAAAPAKDDPVLLERRRSIARDINATAADLARARAIGATARVRKLEGALDDLNMERVAVDGQLWEATAVQAPPAASALTTHALQEALLDDDSILLQYFVGSSESFVWALTRDRVVVRRIARRAELSTFVAAFRQSLERMADKAAGSAPDAAARRLSEAILGPVRALLNRKRVLIVADGPLQAVPFAALPLSRAGRRGKLVIEHAEVTLLPSASAALVHRTDRSRDWPRGVAVFADPVFESDDPRMAGLGAATGAREHDGSSGPALGRVLRSVGFNGSVPRLLDARREARAIGKIAPRSMVVLDFDASRARAMSAELAEFRIVHFATHGLVDDAHPELSGIALSMFDKQGHPQDGYLRVHDIYNLRLPVDLVVLSACNTALGKDVAGEGVVGLARAFLHAGSRRVLATLWRVDDEAASVIMTEFYRALFQAGLSPSAALRQAQLTLRRTPRWQHPRFWAAFVLEGA